MRKMILFACAFVLAICLASPLAADDEYPDNLVRPLTDDGDFFIVSIDGPEGLKGSGERDTTDIFLPTFEDEVFPLVEPLIMPLKGDDIPSIEEGEVPNLVRADTDEGDVFIVSMPGEEGDEEINLVTPGTTEGDVFIISMPDEEEPADGSHSKTLGGLAVVGCLGVGTVLLRKRD